MTEIEIRETEDARFEVVEDGCPHWLRHDTREEAQAHAQRLEPAAIRAERDALRAQVRRLREALEEAVEYAVDNAAYCLAHRCIADRLRPGWNGPPQACQEEYCEDCALFAEETP